ncbi:MAG TPA: 4Fe-4S dicluster domain-containing protein [Phenylobacterium sp.]|jgi:molybdopterin-containing oxidoreductase family iron-sulfur binding subunit|uniref:4Fe-4S dicluster domain-containing protein n=1 Tax=Phenylobacterium sp. TaxID=1871053 RepID=UPI002D3A62ED|nr:4Fe-4S dicluster domain-containing protein [Phenylobacterium sp.]HZZ70316.1 4Fe-4S dicluster domain-containing protein [Phenylobacterium sp.]
MSAPHKPQIAKAEAGSRHLRRAAAEFPAAFAGLNQVDRRDLLKVMGASLALAGLTGCQHDPAPEARPYVRTPDGIVLGKSRSYATAVTFGGFAQPVLGTTHEGRPTKLEGLPEHPASRGATDAFTQAALLGLYDPSRSKGPARFGQPTDWGSFDSAMTANAARLDQQKGEGFRLLTGAITSPTLGRLIEAMLQRWPRARWHVFEPVNDDLRLEAARRAFGRELMVRPRLDLAETVVSFDDDLLGPGPFQTSHARDWGTRRAAYQAGQGGSELLTAEPAPSLTGATSQGRLIASPAEVDRLVVALAAALGVAGVAAPALPDRQAKWLARAVAALRRAGSAACVGVGRFHDPAIQALGLRINDRLGAMGHTAVVTEPLLKAPPDGAGSLAALLADAHAGRVDTLAILDANPIYAAPRDLDAAGALRRVRLRVHMGLHEDETAAFCHWHAPVEHDLETWGDALAVDGRPSLIQPLVRPFYAVRARSVLLMNLQGDLTADARGLLGETWRDKLGDLQSAAWRTAQERGFIDEPAPAVAVSAASGAAALPAASSAGGLAGLTVLVRPDPAVWDGALANNPWLQELPRPFTSLTWDNAVAIAPALAKRLGLKTGDVVRLEAGGRLVEGPVWIMAGQDPSTVVLTLGYGRAAAGLGQGVGFDAGPLRTAAQPWRLEGATLKALGRNEALATTQDFTQLGDFDFVRTAPRGEVAPRPAPPPPASFYPPKPESRPQWGMTVDVDLCIGCNACVTACQAENNVPVVGKAQVAKGRHMHWLRVDHYEAGEPEDPAFFNQPVPCMHCEQAPCEMGCPVNAAVHSDDGLNLQVYNRCIGTRTCSSYCPYKVRRFNWFDFTVGDPPELRAARNPEVTVRSRGVMEKCNYCLQRIVAGKIEAQVAGREIGDGEVRTACQQVCPTNAITFGDISDPKSQVTARKAQGRNYALLEEVNTRPRTTYLARIAPENDDG